MSFEQGIVTPHDHDVLSGRGNFVNYHAGNEHFRALVRKHKVAYVACPKQQKGKFSRMIVDEIRSRNPPGRFLKQDQATKLWYDIGEKKALDKTRQALREGAPEIMKEINVGDEDYDDDEEEDALEQNSSSDELSPITQRVTSQRRNSVPVIPEALQPPPSAPQQPPQPARQQLHSGQFMPPPVSSRLGSFNPITPSMEPSMMLNNVGARQLNGVGPPQPQAMAPPSNYSAPQRIMRNGMMGPPSSMSTNGGSSGPTPIRSLAGFRHAMQQQQAQRNSALYMNHPNHHQQNHQQQQQQHQTGLGMGGHDVRSAGGYPSMHHSILKQLEPRPIGPSTSAVPYDATPTHDYETHEYVAPLPGPLPQRFRTEREFNREASDRSLTMDKVFSQATSSHANRLDNSAVSCMSLSIGDIVARITEADASKNTSGEMPDPVQLAPLFDSSVRLTGPHERRRKAPSRSGSRDGTDLARVMDMSVATLGGELSEIGDASMLRMTESAANMSFTDVFDDADR